MVKIMEDPIKMDDLGGKPTIFGNIHQVSKPKKNTEIAIVLYRTFLIFFAFLLDGGFGRIIEVWVSSSHFDLAKEAEDSIPHRWGSEIW